MQYLRFLPALIIGLSLAFSAQAKTTKKDAATKRSPANSTGLKAGMDQTCNCQIGEDKGVVRFELAENCGEDRLYLQDDLELFRRLDRKGEFTREHISKAAEQVPPKCMLFLMRASFRDRPRTADQKKLREIIDGTLTQEEADKKTYKPDPSMFADCPEANGTPVRVGGKPCITEEYFNIVSNSLRYMSECMGIPLRKIIPKLANESGLNMNAFGPVNDAGIGQFTASALEDVSQNLEIEKKNIRQRAQDGNTACQKLIAFEDALPRTPEDVQYPDANRCHVISIPPNPVRSMIYYGVFYNAMKRHAGNSWKRSGKNDPEGLSLDQLLEKAAIEPKHHEKIKEKLFILAYNTGPAPPVSFLKNWLRYRLNKPDKPINMKEFDFDFWPPTGWTTGDAEARTLADKEGRKKGWDKKKTDAYYRKERNKRRATKILALRKGDTLTLPEYMAAYNDNIYIAAVKAQAKFLDTKIGPGICTEANYL
jgi:hypothetical protein